MLKDFNLKLSEGSALFILSGLGLLEKNLKAEGKQVSLVINQELQVMEDQFVLAFPEIIKQKNEV